MSTDTAIMSQRTVYGLDLKACLAPLLIVSSLMVGIGVWILLHTNGKNGLDTAPLFWLLVVILCPILNLAGTVCLWRSKMSKWMAALLTLPLLPQIPVWYFIVKYVGSYLHLWR